jgi:hypothetical protein
MPPNMSLPDRPIIREAAGIQSKPMGVGEVPSAEVVEEAEVKKEVTEVADTKEA